MKKTEIYELGLWEGTDYPNYAMPNTNMQKIESALKGLTTNVESLKESTDNMKNKVDILDVHIETEEIERKTDDNELRSRITENAEGIEHLDDEVEKQKNNIIDMISDITAIQGAITGISNEFSRIRNKIDTVKNSELKLYTKSVAYPSSSYYLTPIDTGLGLPDWYNESEKKFDAGIYVVTINAYIDTVYASGGRDISYTPTVDTANISFRFNSAGGENPYPMSFSAVATLTTRGSINLPSLGYSASATPYLYDVVMTVTKVS